MNDFSHHIAQHELGSARPYPDLREAKSLLVASDYSGQQKGSEYETYSFLVSSFDHLWLWAKKRDTFRRAFGGDLRRISYKALNDRVKVKMLPSFFEAASWIPGVLVTFIVEKTQRSLFASVDISSLTALRPSFANWSPKLIEKAGRIAHFGGLLVAGLSTEGQDLMWFSDNDDFTATDEHLWATSVLFGVVASQYLPHTMGHMRVGSGRNEDGNGLIEDLLAIPDLAAGTYHDCFVKYRRQVHAGGILRDVLMRDLEPKSSLALRGLQLCDENVLRNVCLYTTMNERVNYFGHFEMKNPRSLPPRFL